MKESLLEAVRSGCRKVARRARRVEIVTSALAGYAASIPQERLLLPEMDPAIHYLGHGDATLAYYLTLDTINFGSGYFPEVLGDPRRSGYRAVASALTRHFAGHGPVLPAQLRELAAQECARMVGLPLSTPAAVELVNLYTGSLNDLGSLVCHRFGGSFAALRQQAGDSAGRLVETLAAMPGFRDVSDYGGLEVPFFKRAQLAAVDLYIAFRGAGAGRFADLDGITVCADNLVPHVLRLDGVLRYTPELSARVDRGEPLEAGSEEEVEIRACAVHAGELLVSELRKKRGAVNALLLDNYLWHRGQEPAYRARPRHRTRTVFY